VNHSACAASALEQCHQALEITIFVNGFSVFVGLCSFEANGLFADKTDWSIHTAALDQKIIWVWDL
jgi:hypothetical protein